MRLPYETSRDRVEQPCTNEVLGESTLGGEEGAGKALARHFHTGRGHSPRSSIHGKERRKRTFSYTKTRRRALADSEYTTRPDWV
jgi:hypothetical protein